MTIYFSWISKTKTASAVHRQDVDIFSLSITQQEGSPARAWVLIKNPLDQKKFPPTSDSCAVITIKPSPQSSFCLFKGSLSATPIKLHDALIRLELTSAPPDAQKQEEELLKKLVALPSWDPLFASQKAAQQLKTHLRTQNTCLYWDRTNGNLGLSHLFKGSTTLDIGDQFDHKSLSFSCVFAPPQGLEVTLEAQWIQTIHGTTNLTKEIQSSFEEKIINTFTGKNFEKGWPRQGERLGRSGYWVVHSSLEEIDPPTTGGLGLYPTFSAPLWTAQNESDPNQIYVKRFWYEGQLTLGWTYYQKRVERVHFRLEHKVQPFFREKSAAFEEMSIRLEDINPPTAIPFWVPHAPFDTGHTVQYRGKVYRCHSAHRSSHDFLQDEDLYWNFHKNIPTALSSANRSSFFLTDRGVQAFEHALEIAKTRLAHWARAFHVTFAGPWNLLMGVTLDHTLYVKDGRLPGGGVSGKVIHMEIKADGETGQQLVWITLGVSIGAQEQDSQPPSPAKTDVYTQDIYVDEQYHNPDPLWRHSPSGIAYLPYNNQAPKDKVAMLAQMSPRYMLKNLVLRNSSTQQEQHLQAAQYPSGKISPKALQDHKTSLVFQLRKLRAREAIYHDIHVTLPNAWAGPAQANFPT